ncbi:LysR family transcriptional regulator (plasmid) [Photobacterium sp. DA100]|uniref:LysR family transcriptional regulator n=1 Tax=Photobacterium sp. DA100 TaxID=3027472 RepID=UPI00247AFF1B|nr:LysR family transcriptional regulator [Photobacterium sp. DA100]WEM45368.1 LysR family transcriptional regulator [Photobacterium sp. DA100]
MARYVNTDEIDIKSIKVLSSLYETRNTYKTAEELSISQSQVTRILSKLRSNLNDRLLVRVGNVLVPTEYFEQIHNKLPELVECIQSTFSISTDFNPETYEGEINISLNKVILNRYGLVIYQELSHNCPRAFLKIEDWNVDSVEKISSNELLVGVNYLNHNIPDSIEQVEIKDESFFLLSSKSHPILDASLISVDVLINQSFIVWNPNSWKEQKQIINELQRKFKRELKVVLKTDSLDVALEACRNNKGIMIASNTIINDFNNLAVSPLPVSLLEGEDKAEVKKINFYYSYINRRSGKLIWVKDCILNAICKVDNRITQNRI